MLQLLDLACFSPVKSSYRTHIADLSTLDDSASVKKARFVKCYYLAREEGLTERVIRSGWRATGINPWNPDKAIYSSQVKHPLVKPIQQNSTTSADDDLLQTPAKPQPSNNVAKSRKGN
jgi:hypothetical protein